MFIDYKYDKQRWCIYIYIYITLIDTEEGHLLIENVVNIFFATPLSVSLHNLLDFYNLFCLCCIVMSRRSVTHYVLWLVDSLILYIYGVDVVEWSRAVDVRLSEWWCSVSMAWVQIPLREEQKFDRSKI